MKLRRYLATALAALVLALSLCHRPPPGAACSAERCELAAPPPLVSAVEHIGITVSQLDASRAFYERVLGFRSRELEPDRSALTGRASGAAEVHAERVELRLGSERIVLSAFTTPRGGRPVPSDTRGNDLWFQHVAIVVSDLDRAYGWLRRHRVTHISPGPQTLPRWNRAASGIRAFYFLDPDGHPLELISFPEGKGDPRWREPRPCVRDPVELCLFLGIDHTAITVSDTERSLAFYRDSLGLRVAGESENYGPEQERLNGVFGARLRITALRAPAGPGVELLEYLAPRGGRRAPADASPHDLAHFEVAVRSTSSTALARASRAAGGAVAAEDAAERAALVRDPDGHALRAGEVDP